MELKWIGCPVNWKHAIDSKTYVCIDCGQESIEYDKQTQDAIRQKFPEPKLGDKSHE